MIPRNGLSLSALEELMQAVHRNAVGLAEDARILLDAGRIPRAYALAVLAGEELGKLQALNAAAIKVGVGLGVDWKSLDKKCTTHGPKAEGIVMLDFLFNDQFPAWTAADVKAIEADQEGLRQALGTAAAMAQLKLSALYVDCTNGHVQEPGSAIRPEWADTAVNAVEKLAQEIFPRIGLPPPPGKIAHLAKDDDWRKRAIALAQPHIVEIKHGCPDGP